MPSPPHSRSSFIGGGPAGTSPSTSQTPSSSQPSSTSRVPSSSQAPPAATSPALALPREVTPLVTRPSYASSSEAPPAVAPPASASPRKRMPHAAPPSYVDATASSVDVAMVPPPVTAAAPAPSAAVEAPVVADYVLGHCFAPPPDDGPRFKHVKVSGPSPLDQGKGKSVPRNKGKGRAEPMWMRTSAQCTSGDSE